MLLPWRSAAALCVVLLLASCSAPQRRAPADSAPAPRSGGYYQDDGPGANPPPNLASIPDAVPRAEPLHKFANRPYEVFGKSYVPSAVAAGTRLRGRASWYGRKFHGKRTASGEIYNMYAMSGAHPTLPIPSYARVTNLRNRRSVVVRINDRGPFLRDRLIDLSYTAALKLGFVQHGSAWVEVEPIVFATLAQAREVSAQPATAATAFGTESP